MKGWQIFVYDDVSNQWYGNETFTVGNEIKLALTCHDYGKQGVQVEVREIK